MYKNTLSGKVTIEQAKEYIKNRYGWQGDDFLSEYLKPRALQLISHKEI